MYWTAAEHKERHDKAPPLPPPPLAIYIQIMRVLENAVVPYVFVNIVKELVQE